MAEGRVPNPERRRRPGALLNAGVRGDAACRRAWQNPKHTAQEEPDAKTKPNREDAHQPGLERSLEQGLEDSFPGPIQSMSLSRHPCVARPRENSKSGRLGAPQLPVPEPLSIPSGNSSFNIFEDFRQLTVSFGGATSPLVGVGNMARKYFGTDGIRGRANGIITPELALKVGQAAGLIFAAATIATACSSAKTPASPVT